MKVILAPIATRISGRFGGMVASNWKGIDLFRRFKPPAQPRTANQLEIRRIFINLHGLWAQQVTYFRDSWEQWAKGKAFIGRNEFLKRNVDLLQGESTLEKFVWSPPDASTIPPVSATFTAGASLITVAITPPTPPTGWAITRAIAACLKDKDYGTVLALGDLTPTEGMDETAPYSIVLTPLSGAILYRCGAWLEWEDDAGKKRYSGALTGSATPT